MAEAWGRSPTGVLAAVSPEPIAAASLGQVLPAPSQWHLALSIFFVVWFCSCIGAGQALLLIYHDAPTLQSFVHLQVSLLTGHLDIVYGCSAGAL